MILLFYVDNPYSTSIALSHHPTFLLPGGNHYPEFGVSFSFIYTSILIYISENNDDAALNDLKFPMKIFIYIVHLTSLILHFEIHPCWRTYSSNSPIFFVIYQIFSWIFYNYWLFCFGYYNNFQQQQNYFVLNIIICISWHTGGWILQNFYVGVEFLTHRLCLQL